MERKSLPHEYKLALRSIRRKAKITKTKLRFAIGSMVSFNDNDLQGCLGYYYTDPEINKREIAIAMNVQSPSIWMAVLLHESCHLDQDFSEDEETIKRWDRGYEVFNKWLHDGVEYTDKVISKAVEAVIECERDCEIRTVKKILKWKLHELKDPQFQIPLTKYIQKSNAYLYSYIMMKERRVSIAFVTSKSYVWSKAPKVFKDDYSKVPMGLRKGINKRLRSKQLSEK